MWRCCAPGASRRSAAPRSLLTAVAAMTSKAGHLADDDAQAPVQWLDSLVDQYRRAATPTAAAPTSGRRPSARSRSARRTRTSGATTSPTASATWSTSSSPRTSAPSRSRSSRSAPTAAAARIPEMHDPAMIERWVDDTVDLIEFANGGTDTEWGAKRAALGHPEPFGLDMIGLGNEENTTTFEAELPGVPRRDRGEVPRDRDHLQLRSGRLRLPLRHAVGLQPGPGRRPGRRALLQRPAVVPGEPPPLRQLRPRGPEGLPR